MEQLCEHCEIGTQPQNYKVALFLHCIGVDTLKIFNGFQFDTPEDRNSLSKIIDKFDQYTIGEVHETLKDTILTQETKKRMKALTLTSRLFARWRKHAISVIVCATPFFVTESSLAYETNIHENDYCRKGNDI